MSDGQGRYVFTSLAAGSYTVEVYLSGFQVQVSPTITLTEGQSGQHDFVLALATRVARSAREGDLLGIGGELVSSGERAFIALLEAATPGNSR